jgi:hypothetical protein
MWFGVCYIVIKLKKILLKYEKNLPSFIFPFKEMIVDRVNGQTVPRYLIYDIIKFNVSTVYNL